MTDFFLPKHGDDILLNIDTGHVNPQTLELEWDNSDLIQVCQLCPDKTLCSALFELAQIENEKGTEEFCDFIYGFPADLNHHGIYGGGNPNDKSIEDTEFITLEYPRINYSWFKFNLGLELSPPEFPLYVDIEYVEMAYALSRKTHLPYYAYFSWNLMKKFTKGNSFGHPPNKFGFILGAMIASDYKNIQEFVDHWCVGSAWETCRR